MVASQKYRFSLSLCGPGPKMTCNILQDQHSTFDRYHRLSLYTRHQALYIIKQYCDARIWVQQHDGF